VQQLSPAGVFLATFGWDVNATKDGLAAATQAEKNLCGVAASEACTVGTQGTGAGQLAYPADVAVDPVTGDVYVADIGSSNARVDKYSASGRFIWTVGKGVNLRTKQNLCTGRDVQALAVKCGPGARSRQGSSEHGAFKIVAHMGNELMVGGPEDLLYVGDEGRVQEFAADGKWVREVAIVSPTPTSTSALAVDQAGYLYVVALSYELGFVANVVRKFAPNGEEITDFVIGAREPMATVTIHGLAVDGMNRLAVIGGEEGLVKSEQRGVYDESYRLLGALYDGQTGARIAEFPVPIGNDGLAFGAGNELYVAATDGQEVLRYTPAPAAELVTGPLLCRGSDEDEASATFRCLPSDTTQ
jgi:hypothetical protein